MANDKWSGSNPWLGLAPYTEGIPLYGRTKESIQLADIIKYNVASVVFGKSGIGKSSLLSAGISPLLREENYIQVRIRLVHNTEVSYIDQIENKVRETVKYIDHLPTDVNNLGLWDFFHRHSFTTENGIDCIPVIILDQFEEIYTLTDANHKKEIITFFNELSALLNDIKPDNVIEEERKRSTIQNDSDIVTPKRGIVKRSAASALNYTSATTFRFVICLREDKLYYLERNSANIPSLKTNRYNLQALSPESALEVIMCPRPELFSNEEATGIIEKLADMGDEGICTVDPAILSLFLYKYYEKKGEANCDNIFADYYQEITKDSKIRNNTIAFLEDHLLTIGGYRNQIPLDDAYANKVTKEEIQFLLDKVLLRTEKRKGIDYIEFSHDRLCAEAKNNRDKRAVLIQKKTLQKKIMIASTIVLLFFAIMFYALLQSNERNKEQQSHVRELNEKNLLLERTSKELEKARESLNVQLSLSEAANDSLLALNEKYALAIDSIKRKDRTIDVLKKTDKSNRQTIAFQSDRIMNLEQEMSFIPEDIKFKARARKDSLANQHRQQNVDELEIKKRILNERSKLNTSFGF